jgi:FtsP/CotA-like multicopper oxidase with cupredoxin domain
MRLSNTTAKICGTLPGAALTLGAMLSASAAHAAVPGIKGPTFALDASAIRLTQPNGKSVYGWGYGCDPAAAPPTFLPAPVGAGITSAAACPSGQLPGPTLIVTQGDTVTVTLTNNLPAAAGNTSILFPGFNVTAVVGTGTSGLLAQEAPNAAACTGAGCNTVTYTFVATTAGTHSYYSGTQGDLQIEMGLFGALVVLPSTVPGNCTGGLAATNLAAEGVWGEKDFRLSQAAFNNPAACYDREYLFQFSEMDDRIHEQAEAQVIADQAKTTGGCTSPTGCLVIATEPYTPGYFLLNGRSMPDDMDPNYSTAQYPNQPYNGNPHMHPGELTLLRIIGQGRWQHPFHEHANHVRVLARDGNLLLDPVKGLPAGPLMFTTTTTPGMTLDGIFYWTGKGLNWDAYAHYNGLTYPGSTTAVDCLPDANGYNTVGSDGLAYTRINYYEWCGDHNKPLEKHPFGQVASGGPATLPDPNIVTNGAWYGGSPYLGPEAMGRAVGVTPLPPAGTIANSPTGEAGFAYMWHSHNEREITTDNVFPGGMMMMMLIDPRNYVIDESN